MARNDHEKAVATQEKKDKMTLIDLFRQLLIHQQLAKMSFHQSTIIYQQYFKMMHENVLSVFRSYIWQLKQFTLSNYEEFNQYDEIKQS